MGIGQTASTSSVIMGTVPLNWFGGTPAGAIGALHTKSHNDPLWHTETLLGTDARQCYDCLPTLNFLTNVFAATPGVGSVTYSSGNTMNVVAGTGTNENFYPLSTLETSYGGLIAQWFMSSIIDLVSQATSAAATKPRES